MTDMVPGPAAETPPGDPEVGKTDLPWRGRDILFGVLAGFGGAFGFFIVYAVFVRASGVGSISGLAAFEFASIVSYVFLGAGLWFFALRRRGRSLRDAGFAKVGAGAVALMLPLTLGVLFVNGLIQLGVMELFGEIKTASDQLGVEEGSLNPSDVWLLLLSTSLVAPVVEEFLFRGLLYRWLRERRGVRAAAVISAAIFAVTHFIPLLMPSIFVLGLALAWVAERYGSLYPPLALHATFNAIATLALVAAG